MWEHHMYAERLCLLSREGWNRGAKKDLNRPAPVDMI